MYFWKPCQYMNDWNMPCLSQIKTQTHLIIKNKASALMIQLCQCLNYRNTLSLKLEHKTHLMYIVCHLRWFKSKKKIIWLFVLPPFSSQWSLLSQPASLFWRLFWQKCAFYTKIAHIFRIISSINVV